MQRKQFLRNSLGLLGTASIVAACSKTDSTGTTASTTPSTGSCSLSPEEVEGPYPYPGGEATNPLNRKDITGGQTGLPLTLNFVVVDVNNNCAVVPNARVDIWQCNKDGYYSGYGNQSGILGTQNYVGQTWLRGYQTCDASGTCAFGTIYPGWYNGRATHIHMEVFVNGVLKKTTQITFSETISDAVHVTSLYAAHGVNTTRNANDGIFGNSASDLAKETVALTGNTTNGYAGSYTIGIAL